VLSASPAVNHPASRKITRRNQPAHQLAFRRNVSIADASLDTPSSMRASGIEE
jgi:hypothetical protein